MSGTQPEIVLKRTDIQDLLDPGAEALGFEVLAVEMAGGARHSVLRVFIDGPRGVTVDDCAAASHQFSAILDVEDPIAGQYTLEVSSPGLDRPLTRVRHFEAVLGQNIRVQTEVAVAGRRRFRGQLRSADGEYVEMAVDGEIFSIPLSLVAKARLVPDLNNSVRTVRQANHGE